LETRLALSVSTKLIAGQLVVTGDNSGNTITLDHSGTQTLVNGLPFADGSITKGIVVNSGTGKDTINILATQTQVAVHGQAGSDVVNVGKNGNAQLIHGVVSIDNALGSATLNVNDQADKSPRNVSLTATSGTGAGLGGLASSPIDYNVVEVTKVVLNGGSAGNIFNVDTPVTGLTSLIHINSGTGNNKLNVLRGGLGTVEIQGQGGNDTVHIASANLTQDVTRFVTIRNAPSKTNVTVDDSGDTSPRNATLFSFAGLTDILGLGTIDGLSETIAFDPAAVGTVTVDGGSHGNTFTVSATGSPASSVVLNTGIGADTVNVQGTTGPLTINGQSGADVVNVGNAGSVQPIVGPVTVTNFGNFTALTVDDSAGTQSRNVSIDVGSAGFGTISGMGAMIRYRSNDVSSVTVNGGTAGNSFTIRNTVDNSSSPVTVVNSGIGNDTVNVLGSTGALTINGQNGRDSVNLFVTDPSKSIKKGLFVDNRGGFTALNVDASAFSGPENVTLDVNGLVGSISGLTPVAIGYNIDDFSSVTVSGGSGNNNFVVLNTAANRFLTVSTNLNIGPGSDTVLVEGAAGALSINGQGGTNSITVGLGDVSAIRGGLGISNPGGQTALVVDDSGDVNRNLVEVNSNFIFGPGPVQIELFQPESLISLTINAGPAASNGGNFIAVNSTPAGVPVIINPGDGQDTIVVGDATETLAGILGPVTIDGSGNNDTLTIEDQLSTTPHTYTITPTTVSRSGAATIIFFGITNLIVDKGVEAGTAPQAAGLTLTPTIRAGDLATLSGRLVDPDPHATLTLDVDWGDGSKPEQRKPGHKPFVLHHRYAKPGTYTVRAIWTASNGESNFQQRTIIVAGSDTQSVPFRSRTAHHRFAQPHA
jgi:hypothetical protein